MSKYVVIIVSLILANIASLSTILKLKEDNYKPTGETNTALSYRDLFYYNYDYNIIANEGIPLDIHVNLFDTSSTKISLKDLIQQNNFEIFIRYSLYDCSDCIHAIIKTINELPSELTKYFVLISDYESENSFIAIQQRQNTSIATYNIDYDTQDSGVDKQQNALGIPLEGKGMTFVFTVNALFETDNFFVPDKGDMTSLNRYFNAILKKKSLL